MGLNWWKNKVMERMAEMERLGTILVCGSDVDFGRTLQGSNLVRIVEGANGKCIGSVYYPRSEISIAEMGYDSAIIHTSTST